MATITKSAFSIGTVSNLLYHRVDLPFHPYACKDVHNAIVLPSGAIARRVGTKYVQNTAFPLPNMELFRFSLDETYILIFSANAIFIRKTDDSGGSVASVTSPYSTSEGFEIKMTQINDKIWIAHPNHDIMVLVRYSETSWALIETGVGKPGQDTVNVDGGKLVTGTNTGGDNFSITCGVAIFDSTRIGQYFFVYADYWRRFMITNLVGTQNVLAYQENPRPEHPTNFINIQPWAYQDPGAEGDLRFGGLLANIFTYQDRMCVSASPEKPKTIFMSKTGIYDDFTSGSPLAEDDGLELQLTAGVDGTPAYWAAELKYLLVNAGAALLWLSSASGTGPITPISKQASVGAYTAFSPISPVKVKDELIVVGRDKRSLYAVDVKTNTNEFGVIDITAGNPDLFKDTEIKQVDFQQDPWPIIWVLTTDGKLYGCTYDKQMETRAWHSHEIGFDPDLVTYSFIGSILVAPAEGSDKLWMTVLREGSHTTIEYMELTRDPGDTSAHVVDSVDNPTDEYLFQHVITPIMPAFQDNSGLTEGDDIRLKTVRLSLVKAKNFILQSPGGWQDITVVEGSGTFTGNTDDLRLPTATDDNTDITVTSSDGPFILTAIRYETEVQ